MAGIEENRENQAISVSGDIATDNQLENEIELPDVPIRTDVAVVGTRSKIPRLRRPLGGRRVVPPVEVENRSRRPAAIAGERLNASNDHQRSHSSDEPASESDTSNYDEDDTEWNLPKRKRNSYSSSSSTTSSKKPRKYKLFEAMSDKDRRQWNLPEELAENFNTNSRKFINDKETITNEFPVPTNIDTVPVMDEFMTSMLSEYRRLYSKRKKIKI